MKDFTQFHMHILMQFNKLFLFKNPVDEIFCIRYTIQFESNNIFYIHCLLSVWYNLFSLLIYNLVIWMKNYNVGFFVCLVFICIYVWWVFLVCLGELGGGGGGKKKKSKKETNAQINFVKIFLFCPFFFCFCFWVFFF